MLVNSDNLEKVEIKIKQLNLTWNIRKNEKGFMVSFKNIEVKDRGCLISAWEMDLDLDKAKILYINRILDETLVFKAYTENRKEIVLSFLS